MLFEECHSSDGRSTYRHEAKTNRDIQAINFKFTELHFIKTKGLVPTFHKFCIKLLQFS